MTNLKSDFHVVMSTPEWVLIRDNANTCQTMSITNDAENVVRFLKENAILIANSILYYIDTDGRVDIIEHDGEGNFTDFKPGYENEDKFYNSIGS